MGLIVGILGLQGDFSLHEKSLKKTGVETRIVRTPEELKTCKGLILPGGESTTFVNLLRRTGMFEAIRKFAEDHSVMGTCAGLITLATDVAGGSLETLGLIDLSVERNAYGRQVNSFVDTVIFSALKDKPEFEGVFIRAPKIRTLGRGTKAVGTHQGEPVAARNQNVLVMTFHPELTDDSRIHDYFVKEMAGGNS